MVKVKRIERGWAEEERKKFCHRCGKGGGGGELKQIGQNRWRHINYQDCWRNYTPEMKAFILSLPNDSG